MTDTEGKSAAARGSAREALRAWMELAIKEEHGSARRWGGKAGVAGSTITRFLADPNSAMPSTTTILKLAAVTKEPPPPYRTDSDKSGVDVREKVSNTIAGASDAVLVTDKDWSRDYRDLIPVMGARAGLDQSIYLDDEPKDHIPRPPALAGITNAYALLLVGESMRPKYEPGQILHINPHKKPRPGKGVVIFKPGNVVLVKEYVRRTAEGVIVREYQPQLREFLIPERDVVEIHSVVGLEED